MSAPGVPLSFADGELMVEAKPSEVPPDQLASLRRRKFELLPVLAAYGTAMVAIRPATPIPAPVVMGSWEVWSRPLRPRRGKARRASLPAAIPAGPNGCAHCGGFCDPRDTAESIRLPGGRWEHFACHLHSEKTRG